MQTIKNQKGNETIIFAKTFEHEAYEQIKKLCNLEAYQDSKIRVMPDAHAGKGCTVGTTMTISDKVTPNLVGVDIGCFTGDTKIPLLNGTQKTLKELYEIGDKCFVYSLDENLKLVVGTAIPLKTRINVKLLEVMISGGEIIKCTPDHKFMLLDGSYKQAKDLIQFDSLMPLYRSYQSRDGYERIFTTGGNGIITHKLVAKQFLGEMKKDDIIHHKDHLWFNNYPSNIEYKNNRLHSSEHRIKKPIFNTMVFKKKRLKTLNIKGFYNPIFLEKKKIIAKINIKKYLQTEQFKENIKNNGKRGAKYLIKYNKSKKGRLKSSENGKKNLGKHHNHKVLYVKKLNYKDDVYCLNVDKYHNFALSVGVFVHNCGMLTVKLKDKQIDFKKLDEIINNNIPNGFNIHKKVQDKFDFSELMCENVDFARAVLSVGTLGGGNHFIEVGKSESTDDIFLVIHSGSRKLGGDVCKYYQNKAIQNVGEMNKIKKQIVETLKAQGRDKEIHAELKKIKNPITDKELACLKENDFDDYMNDMRIVQSFAKLNRKTIADIIIREMSFVEDARFETIHNYIDFRRMILRKGAVSSEKGEMLIIPINMRDGSLLCIGKGNEDWNYSAPHGAGRLMSRSKAKELLNMETFTDSMKGIYTTSVGLETIDESPQAYKSIEEIKSAIIDTVEVIDTIKPLYNFKSH